MTKRAEQDDDLPMVSLARDVERLQNDPNFLLTAGRALAVLGAFGVAKRKLNVAEISRMTAIPPQAVRRCLYTLTQLGFMGQSGSTYTPRPRLLSLGYVFFAAMPFATLAQPVLDELHQRFRLAFSIGVFDDDEVTYVVRTGGGREFETNNLLRPNSAVPDRRPAYCTAPGRVMLARLNDAEIATYLARTPMRQLTDRTIVAPHLFRAALAHVAETGYCVVDQEANLGLRSIAIPILNDSGAVIAALGGLALAAEWSVGDLETKVLPAMRMAGRELSLNW